MLECTANFRLCCNLGDGKKLTGRGKFEPVTREFSAVFSYILNQWCSL